MKAEKATHPFLRSWLGSGGNSLGRPYDLTYQFHWGANILEEAWIELQLPGQTYWCKIPYGFTRNPKDALAPAGPASGAAFIAAAIKNCKKEDKILSWTQVNYDSVRIHSDWFYELIFSNGEEATAEIVLYRDDKAGGKNGRLWKLDAPKTALSLREATGEVIICQPKDTRLHDDGMHRSDKFRLIGKASYVRGWATIRITIADEQDERVIPSSLYRHADGKTKVDYESLRSLPP
jgi:hypothetical protein